MGKLIQLIRRPEAKDVDSDLALLDKYHADKARREKERKEDNEKVLRSYRIKRRPQC